VRSVTGWLCRRSSSANLRVLLHVQRRGDSGCPRVTGSTKASRACSNPGSISVKGLRPPPTLRRRDATASPGCASRCSNSRTPVVMVFRASPVAAETVVTPPQPMADDSAAAHCLRIRSSITGDRAKYFCRIRSIVVASCMHRRSSKNRIPTRRICLIYFFAVPNFKTSTSIALTQVVNSSAPAVLLAGSSNPVDQALAALQDEEPTSALIESLAMEQVSSRNRGPQRGMQG